MPERLILPLQDASKLDANQAKTVMYWRLGTPAIVDPFTRSYPALGLIGSSGTGKSTIQGAIINLNPESCHTFSCQGVTPAVTRDELAKAIDKVAVIEEFDEVTDLKAASKYVQARCYRDTSDLSYKEPLEKGGYRDKIVHLWGATVYHCRNAPSDPALVSRSILVYTRHEKGPYPEYDIGPEIFREVYGSINWKVIDSGIDFSGRVYDTWKPILRVANAIGDTDWLKWAENQIRLLQARLEGAAEYDYRQAVLAQIVQVLVARESSLMTDPWDRIAVNEDIGLALRSSLLPNISPWEVADTIKGLGFRTSRKGGRLWLLPTPVEVILACHENRYEDEWIDEIREQWNRQHGGAGT